MSDQQASEAPWYESPLGIVLSLFCCWPLGLVLLWSNRSTSLGWKIAGTVVFGGLALVTGINQVIQSGKPASPVAEAPRQLGEVTESCYELSRIFGASSPLSNIDKAAAWKDYSGKRFEWDLRITKVQPNSTGGFDVYAKCAPTSVSPNHDLQLSYQGDAQGFVHVLEKDKVYKLKGALKPASFFLGLEAEGIPEASAPQNP